MLFFTTCNLKPATYNRISKKTLTIFKHAQSCFLVESFSGI